MPALDGPALIDHVHVYRAREKTSEHAPIDSPGRLDSELCYLTDCAALWLIVKFISFYNEVRLYRVVHFDLQLPGYLHF